MEANTFWGASPPSENVCFPWFKQSPSRTEARMSEAVPRQPYSGVAVVLRLSPTSHNERRPGEQDGQGRPDDMPIVAYTYAKPGGPVLRTVFDGPSLRGGVIRFYKPVHVRPPARSGDEEWF